MNQSIKLEKMNDVIIVSDEIHVKTHKCRAVSEYMSVKMYVYVDIWVYLLNRCLLNECFYFLACCCFAASIFLI